MEDKERDRNSKGEKTIETIIEEIAVETQGRKDELGTVDGADGRKKIII